MAFENPIQDYVEIVKHGISKKFKDGKPKKGLNIEPGHTENRHRSNPERSGKDFGGPGSGRIPSTAGSPGPDL